MTASFHQRRFRVGHRAVVHEAAISLQGLLVPLERQLQPLAALDDAHLTVGKRQTASGFPNQLVDAPAAVRESRRSPP